MSVRTDAQIAVEDTLGFLVPAAASSTWRIARVVEDHLDGSTATFQGSAGFRFDRSAEGRLGLALYEEDGELCLGKYHGHSRRCLEYLDRGDGTAEVRFADGRHFVDLDLRSGSYSSLHLCGEDRYEIHSVVRSLDHMEERWLVSGPSKEYEAVTTLHRVG